MAVDDKYVMNGVWLTCDKGVSPSRFNVTPKPVQLYDEHFANELDKIPLVNILPFGVCSVTRTPCMPAPVMWERVMEDGLTVLGARPLLDTSKCMCGVGGKIAIHFTKADATAAVELDQKLDQIDAAADAVEEASGWGFWGGLAMGIGGAILVATGVGAPLGAAMITGAGYLMTASTIAGTAAVAVRGATKFARDPSKEVGLSIVGEVAWEAAKNYVMQKLGGKLIGKLANSKLGQRIANSRFARTMEDRFANAFGRNRTPKPLCVGEPVDVATGKVINEAIDFELNGPLPLVWRRVWYSTSAHEGALGHGWHHSYDEELYVDDEVIILRLPDGRYTGSELIPLGEAVFIRSEKITLAHTTAGYVYVDADGVAHHFSHSSATDSYKLSRLERAGNAGTIVFEYSADGHLTGLVDSAGRELKIEHDAAGRLLSIQAPHPTEPRGQVTVVRYSYNRQGHLVKAADALGQAWQFRYQGSLLVRATYKNGVSFYYRYDGTDARARCLRTWGDDGIYACQLSYDLENHRTTVVDSVGAQRVYAYDPELGVVTQLFDARGGVSSFEYNEFGELLTETDPLGYQTLYDYDERGNCIVEIQPDGAKFQRQYDEQDCLIALTDALGSQQQWQYNEQRQLLARKDPTGRSITYTYQNGRLTQITDSLTGRSTSLGYDAAGNLLELRNEEGATSRWLYDAWGRPYKITDVRGNVQWREYDLLNRAVKVNEPDGNVRFLHYDALDNIIRAKDRRHDVQYAYRGLGRLIRRVEAGVAVEFLHDTEERLRAVVNEHGLAYRFELDAEGDVTAEVSFDGLTRQYRRDIGRRVIEMVLPDEQAVRYEYDQVARVTKVRYPDGQINSFTYRADGALLSASNNTIDVTFTRDLLGNVLEEAQGVHTVTSEFDAAGRRTKVTSSMGADLTFSRDRAGNVERMQAGQWQALFERDAQGLEIQRSLSGGVRTRWKRDQIGRPTEQHIRTGAGRQERTRAYAWQSGDQLLHIQDSTQGLSRFEHDAWGNLVATTYPDGHRELRLPDATGNLFTTVQRQDRRYGPAGQLLEANGTRYAYDALGNLIRKTTTQGQEWRYTWNAAGMLCEVLRPDGQPVRFTYDALGRRISKSYQGQTKQWLWDGNTPLHEWYAPDSLVTSAADVVTWVFEDDSFTPVGKLQGNAQFSIIADHLGTPLEMLDQYGQQAWLAELSSYGRVRQLKGEAQACPFRYPGQYEDLETGLYYNRFRYYDPESGQYVSQDPLRLKSNNPNLYAYAHDPTSWVDLFGCSIFNPVPWTAPTTGTGFDYKVYQQQINWDLPLTAKGGGTETNLDRALRGEAPFVVKNGRYEQINLHHSQQNGKGPLFELSKGTHQRYYGSNALHPHLPNKHPDHPVDRDLFNTDREQYWKDRAGTVQKARSAQSIGCKK
ncbi:DUF4280 domain-containing protein [Hymenobacter sp. BT186]|uniref:DUF4280 domain-containing protein n=1 Tax=Hymenobacter telluris TaxID=2816474 RepID=A0A939EXP5_9BACT|nr:DUF6531 domain-containing protein [Hymenobacter telluris]MBO0359104.1 DUF4280 domain-containing protein [Hymenobacter telluris]MBW3375130.1 DUF4280 domain-containing protein [Hymenobacter norwichensis]